jgi:dTDP-4-amino-4,6-dideoxygalactose transaminase
VGFARGCANGTDALQIALRALGVIQGDTVVSAANAGGYTTTAATLIGANVIYADVDRETHLLTVETLQELMDSQDVRPKVVVVTHLYGAAAEVGAIVNWAHNRGILVVEDCAQSLGAFDGQLRVGSIGDVGTTSFYPTKNLGALGDGGAIFTNDSHLADSISALRQYGWTSKYNSVVPNGTNSRLDELQAAFLRLKLGSLDEINDRRRVIHSLYEEAAGKSVHFVNRPSSRYVAHLAVIEIEDRQRVASHFEERGISTAIHYPIPDHLQKSMGKFSNPVPLKNTEILSGRILSLPLFPELTDNEVGAVQLALSELD